MYYGVQPLTMNGAAMGSDGAIVASSTDKDTDEFFKVAALGAGTYLAIVVGSIALLGVTGYYWGRAVAPSKKARGKYGTIGAVSNIFFPILGPGVMTVVAVSK